MRTFRNLLLLAILCVAFAPHDSSAKAQDSYVPTAVEQIPDSLLRDALAQYKPNYNHLPRGEQILSYVNIYQTVHGGQPPLSPQDASLLSWSRQQAYQPPPQTYYYDPSWDDDSDFFFGDSSFFFGAFFGGGRPHRPGPGWGGGHGPSRPPPGFGRPPSGGPGRPPGVGPGGGPPGGRPGGGPGGRPGGRPPR